MAESLTEEEAIKQAWEAVRISGSLGEWLSSDQAHDIIEDTLPILLAVLDARDARIEELAQPFYAGAREERIRSLEAEVERLCKHTEVAVNFECPVCSRKIHRDGYYMHVRACADALRAEVERLRPLIPRYTKAIREYQDEIAVLRIARLAEAEAFNTDAVRATHRAAERIDDLERKLVKAKEAPEAKSERPRIVCLCGSTRFMDAFFDEGWRLTLEGVIVVSVGVCKHAKHHGAEALGEDVVGRLDELHLRKIDLADEVRILNVGGYVGESTANEIAYATRQGKSVTWLEPALDAALRGEEGKT